MANDIFTYAIFSWLFRALVLLYGLWLATRFVQAVEKLTDRMERRGS